MAKSNVSTFKALVDLHSYAAEERRRLNPNYTPLCIHVADEHDPKLATLLQAVEDAKKALDDYILAPR